MDQYAERLGTGRTTVSLDIRACGRSGDPSHFCWADTVRDIETLAGRLALGPLDIVGPSRGGFVAGFYAADHPEARIVSIDGTGPGMPTIGSVEDRAAFAAFQAGMKAAFRAMTEPPDEGDRSSRDAQIEMLTGSSRASATPLPTRGRWRSGTSSILDEELDTLERANRHVEVARLPLMHLAPAWDAIDDVARLAKDFLARPLPA